MAKGYYFSNHYTRQRTISQLMAIVDDQRSKGATEDEIYKVVHTHLKTLGLASRTRNDYLCVLGLIEC